MPYQFLEPRIDTDDPAGPRANHARPDVYTANALAPQACRHVAERVVQAHADGLSWESRTRYAQGAEKEWDVNRGFRSSWNLQTDFPGLQDAYAVLDHHVVQAFPTLGLDPKRETVRRISDQCIFYGPGDYLADHADDSSPYEDEEGQMVWQVIKPDRHLVGVLWLTTQTDDGAGAQEFAGGELRFNSLVDEVTGEALTVRPAAGKLVIFPASAWFRHEVLEVRAGTRITVTRWWEVVPRGV